MAERLHLILTSDTREKMQMAGMITAVSAAMGSEVSVFVSMNALRYFRKQTTNVDVPCEGEVGQLLQSKKAPLFTDLFHQAVTLGTVQVAPCSMAMDILGLTPADLVSYMGKPVGLTKFLSELDGSHVLTF